MYNAFHISCMIMYQGGGGGGGIPYHYDTGPSTGQWFPPNVYKFSIVLSRPYIRIMRQ